MQNSTKVLQLLGIPFTALLSVIFGLFLMSFPIGIYVVFESDIGGDINYDYPITHLDLFTGTTLYQTPSDISIGDAFAVLWIFYVVIFVIATLGPRHGFLKSLSPILYFGNYENKSNYMIGALKWFCILIFISILINFVQEEFGIVTVPPLDDNDLIQFFYVSLAPLLEEFGFRLILLGIPLFVFYSHKSSIRHFIRCLWIPSNLDIYDFKKAIFLIIFVGVSFGFAHVAFDDSWTHGKFTQATAGGIILGWVYLRYGFIASLLIHWATNYFIFSYANIVSQLNFISIEDAFSHSLLLSLEQLFVITGILSVCILILSFIVKNRH